MKIGIIGQGYVGSAIKIGFKRLLSWKLNERQNIFLKERKSLI